MSTSTYFAAVGDVHGEIRAMEWLLHDAQKRHSVEFSFVLQVGDFEPHRHEQDLASMAAPAKYRKIGDFPKYVTGEYKLAWPVFFIGGNHEPYAFLDMFPFGGEIAPGFTYFGRTGELEIAGVKVAGLSGIHHPSIFEEGRPPISEIDHRSNKDYIGFTEDDVIAALDFNTPDVLLLHDWPEGLVDEEDIPTLRSQAPQIENFNEVGNPIARELVDYLKPQLVLCGHVHLSHRSVIRHEDKAESTIVCLAKVAHNPNAVSVFEVTDSGEIKELA